MWALYQPLTSEYMQVICRMYSRHNLQNSCTGRTFPLHDPYLIARLYLPISKTEYNVYDTHQSPLLRSQYSAANINTIKQAIFYGQ
ncbi:hypothetical protein MTR_4g079505 [Medicago truncatula]|uniref:Uncharacterized protein n=1 Tax=Medicago truncatula TaxID=3880 RepID=A0A072UMW2_MEDTR|nr:hypothetical protein MTR_4g079505 [Medicago truncatula]